MRLAEQKLSRVKNPNPVTPSRCDETNAVNSRTPMITRCEVNEELCCRKKFECGDSCV